MISTVQFGTDIKWWNRLFTPIHQRRSSLQAQDSQAFIGPCLTTLVDFFLTLILIYTLLTVSIIEFSFSVQVIGMERHWWVRAHQIQSNSVIPLALLLMPMVFYSLSTTIIIASLDQTRVGFGVQWVVRRCTVRLNIKCIIRMQCLLIMKGTSWWLIKITIVFKNSFVLRIDQVHPFQFDRLQPMILWISWTENSALIESIYASTLTASNANCSRDNCRAMDYHYEVIQIKVAVNDYYTIQSSGDLDTDGYLYEPYYNVFNPSSNLLLSDDDGCIRRQFCVTYYLEMNGIYELVVTTSLPNAKGSFTIHAMGASHVSFHRAGTYRCSTTILRNSAGNVLTCHPI